MVIDWVPGPRVPTWSLGQVYSVPFREMWFIDLCRISHNFNSYCTRLPPAPESNQCEDDEHKTTNLDQLKGSSI